MSDKTSKPQIIRFPEADDQGRSEIKKCEAGMQKPRNSQILPICCPNCCAIVGFLDVDKNRYLVDGCFCKECGAKLS